LALEIQEIIDEWTQMMVGCCEWRFLRARDNPSQKTYSQVYSIGPEVDSGKPVI
jgi:hypothetical protein